MADSQLTDYIRQRLTQGTKRAAISAELVRIGWSPPQINEAMNELHVPMDGETPPPQALPSPSVQNEPIHAVSPARQSPVSTTPSRLIALGIVIIIILGAYLAGARVWVSSTGAADMSSQTAGAANAASGGGTLGSTLGGAPVTGGSQWTLNAGWKSGPTLSFTFSFGGGGGGGNSSGATGSQSPYGGLVGGPSGGGSGGSGGKGGDIQCHVDAKGVTRCTNQD